MALLAAILLSVTLASPFGEAEARALTIKPDFSFEVYVEVSGQPEAVLVRMVGAAGELDPVAMSDLGEGRWGTIVELTSAENLMLGFEVLRDDESVLSDLSSLEDLGIDPAVFTSPEAVPVATGGDRSYGWLVVAGAAALLALALVGWWAFGVQRTPGDDHPDDASSDVEEPSPS